MSFSAITRIEKTKTKGVDFEALIFSYETVSYRFFPTPKRCADASIYLVFYYQGTKIIISQDGFQPIANTPHGEEVAEQRAAGRMADAGAPAPGAPRLSLAERRRARMSVGRCEPAPLPACCLLCARISSNP